MLPLKLVPILERLLKLLPSDQECNFTADDGHATKTGFSEKLERAKANYLSKHLNAALKGSKWEHSAGWHLYRHTFASGLLDNGYSKTDIKELIGWMSDEMAQHYQHQTFDRKAAIINGLALRSEANHVLIMFSAGHEKRALAQMSENPVFFSTDERIRTSTSLSDTRS